MSHGLFADATGKLYYDDNAGVKGRTPRLMPVEDWKEGLNQLPDGSVKADDYDL